MVTYREDNCETCMRFSRRFNFESQHQCRPSKKQFVKLLFDYCLDCCAAEMAAVPQGVFIAQKVRENMVAKINAIDSEPRHQRYDSKHMELSPLKYNSKLMNSIWGLYNRYSVHNFKMNTDANKSFNLAEQQRVTVLAQTGTESNNTALFKNLDSVWPITMGHSY